MARSTPFRGTYNENVRPTVVTTPDSYITIQSETTLIGCGECRRKININDYVTGWSTEGSVDMPPGGGTVTLNIPDNSINDFFMNDQFMIVPMMEIEIYAKGYYLINGLPQYYRVFWGLVINTSTSWSAGVTTVTLSLKDILHWWELTNIVLNPAFLNTVEVSSPNYNLVGSQVAGKNPYSLMIQLASEVSGDMSFTTISFNSNGGQLERTSERQFVAGYYSDVMSYWAEKFKGIKNSLVIYGLTGTAYPVRDYSNNPQFTSVLPKKILDDEDKRMFEGRLSKDRVATVSATDIAVARYEIPRAGGVEFFQYESKSKLQMACDARDQMGYEFFCDCNGDLVFKPPFFNMDVYDNKPISWIQNFELIDDSINDSSTDVYTHITASGAAFGGKIEWGVTDGVTQPHSGVYDYHLLKRYGWRRFDYSCEWAGNPRTLFFHLIDMLDKLNSKRINGTFTIPMRPELKMGFPIFVEKYDSFFYITGISHNMSYGGEATSTITVSSRRSKFIAPHNIGKLSKANDTVSDTDNRISMYEVTFPNSFGTSSGLSNIAESNPPRNLLLRDPNTGKVLGYPNVVMVYRESVDSNLKELRVETARTASENLNKKSSAIKNDAALGMILDYRRNTTKQLSGSATSHFRSNRYETGVTNLGPYDYAHDTTSTILDMRVLPFSTMTYGNVSPIITDSKLGEYKTEFEAATKDFKSKQDALTKSRSAYFGKKRDPKKTQKDFLDKKETKELIADANDSYTKYLEKKARYEYALKTKQTIDDKCVIVRPISDERGFEVIGHYRYGRGATFNRGLVTDTSKDTKTSLALPISTGELTTAVAAGTTGAQASIDRFINMSPEQSLTSMVPEVSVGSNNTSSITQVSLQDGPKPESIPVSVDADYTINARLLNELKPAQDYLGGDSQACSCGLGRQHWLDILPTTVIQDIVSGKTAENRDPTSSIINNQYTFSANLSSQATGNSGITSGAINNAIQNVSASAFFDHLNAYLRRTFTETYRQQETQYRDLTETASSTSSNPGLFSSGIPDPLADLRQRAGRGDPIAQQELKRKAKEGQAEAIRAKAEFDRAIDSIGWPKNGDSAVVPPTFQSVINPVY